MEVLLFVVVQYMSYCSPNSVVTLGVLTVGVKDGCLIGGARARMRLSRCYLQYIHSPRDLRGVFRLRRLAESQACRIWWAGASALVVAPCSFSDLVITFRGNEGNLVLWWSKVDFSWQLQRLEMYRFRGKRSTLDKLISWQVQ